MFPGFEFIVATALCLVMLVSLAGIGRLAAVLHPLPITGTYLAAIAANRKTVVVIYAILSVLFWMATSYSAQVYGERELLPPVAAETLVRFPLAGVWFFALTAAIFGLSPPFITREPEATNFKHLVILVGISSLSLAAIMLVLPMTNGVRAFR